MHGTGVKGNGRELLRSLPGRQELGRPNDATEQGVAMVYDDCKCRRQVGAVLRNEVARVGLGRLSAAISSQSGPNGAGPRPQAPPNACSRLSGTRRTD